MIWILSVGADYPFIRATPVKLIQKNFKAWQKITDNRTGNATHTKKFLKK
jgi:hypothetical protein